MDGDYLTKLYDSYNKLNDAGPKIGEEVETYKVILSCVNGSAKEKQLCIQFISMFFINFPDLFTESIDSVLDMLEDEDVNIRSKAIREIPNICKKRKESVAGITDILSQMLMVEDQSERALVASSLITIANVDPKSFFEALFPNLEAEAELREQIIVFIRDKFNQIEKHLLTEEVEEFIFNGFVKIIANDCSNPEFEVIMNILSDFNISKSLQGHNALLTIIKSKAQIGAIAHPTNYEFISKLLMCVEHGLKYFFKFSPSTVFFKYLIENFLPLYGHLKADPSFRLDLEMLQLLAQISPFISLETAGEFLQAWQKIIFDLFLAFVPLPVATEEGQAQPPFEFIHLEALLFTFHQLCKFNPKFFEALGNPELQRDFRIRLQSLANGVQQQSSKLQRQRSALTAEELKKPKNQKSLLILKSVGNIKALILDFFKTPPCFKNTVKLSFAKEKGRFPDTLIGSAVAAAGATDKPADKTEAVTEVRKRPLITAPEGSSPPKKLNTGNNSANNNQQNRSRNFNNNNNNNNQSPYRKVNSGNNNNNNNRNSSGSWRGGSGGYSRGGGRGGFRGGNRGGRRW